MINIPDYKNTLLDCKEKLIDTMLKCDIEAYRNPGMYYYIFLDFDGTIHTIKDDTLFKIISLNQKEGFLIYIFFHKDDTKSFINDLAFDNLEEVIESILFRFNIKIKSKSHTKDYYKFITTWLAKNNISEEDINVFFSDIKSECVNAFNNSRNEYCDIFEDCLKDSDKCLSRISKIHSKRFDELFEDRKALLKSKGIKFKRDKRMRKFPEKVRK